MLPQICARGCEWPEERKRGPIATATRESYERTLSSGFPPPRSDSAPERCETHHAGGCRKLLTPRQHELVLLTPAQRMLAVERCPQQRCIPVYSAGFRRVLTRVTWVRSGAEALGRCAPDALEPARVDCLSESHTPVDSWDCLRHGEEEMSQ